MFSTLFFQFVFHFLSCVAESEGNFKVHCFCGAEMIEQLIDLMQLESYLIALFLNLGFLPLI